jgi:ATP-dependent DNA helicase RecG
MQIKQLKTLIKHGESDVLEFKNSTGSISSGMQTACAFLNSNAGGTVVFGVKDNGNIIGQEVTDKTRKEIAVELNKIEPQAKIDIKYVKIAGDRQAIIMLVSPGPKAPYTYDGRSFTRNQSTTMRMSKEEYMYLHHQNNPTLWEGLANTTCKIGNLDQRRIRDVVRLAIDEKRLPTTAIKGSIKDFLKKLNLLVNEELTNAAVVLFCKDEEHQLFQCHMKLARFRGTDKTEFIDTKFLRANVFDLYDKAIEYLTFSLPVAARIVPGRAARLEEPAIPYNVLREAVTNALIHRDYSNTGGSIDIAIYDNRVNITNIGALPKGVVLTQLSKTHPSIPRNPLIANAFYLCGMIEKWGRGTLDMIQDCKAAGNPPPKYEEIGGSFSVTLPLKKSIRSTRSIGEKQQNSYATLTPRQKEIIEILKAGPLSRKQIISKMKMPPADRTIQVELLALNKIGLIAQKGKTRAIVWFIARV